jgi:hypothetical protein
VCLSLPSSPIAYAVADRVTSDKRGPLVRTCEALLTQRMHSNMKRDDRNVYDMDIRRAVYLNSVRYG